MTLMLGLDGAQRHMSNTLVQLHFVRGLINHRLRFGTPSQTRRLDKYRSLAVFPIGSVFGYIRWSANEFGTKDWRLYVLQTQTDGPLSNVVGVTPAVKTLLYMQGTAAVKRGLCVLDKVERSASNGLGGVPVSYWRCLNNALLLRKAPPRLPRNCRISEVLDAR